MKSAEAISFHVTAQDMNKPCLVSMDSDLEAFSLYPTRGSFTVLSFQIAVFTKCANTVFLSY